MKNLSKLTALALSGVLALSLAACGGSGTASTPAPETSAPGTPAPETASPAGETAYTVGICQLAPHVALDAATEGFMDAINSRRCRSGEV